MHMRHISDDLITAGVAPAAIGAGCTLFLIGWMVIGATANLIGAVVH